MHVIHSFGKAKKLETKYLIQLGVNILRMR